VNGNHWIRQTHRWLGIAFTVTVVVTTVALQQKEPVVWMSYLPLLPLAFLEFTGLYLLLQPHVAKWRRGRRTEGVE
jgi:hypothetical protein